MCVLALDHAHVCSLRNSAERSKVHRLVGGRRETTFVNSNIDLNKGRYGGTLKPEAGEFIVLGQFGLPNEKRLLSQSTE